MNGSMPDGAADAHTWEANGHNGGISCSLKPFGAMEPLRAAEKLHHLTSQGIDGFLNEAFGRFGHAPAASVLFAHYVYVDVMMAASRLIGELGGDPDAVLGGVSGIDALIECGGGVDSIKETLSKCLERVISYRDTHSFYKYSDIVSKAKEYIQMHFAEQGISLHTVAKEVNISPNHFCTIYRRETGETFVDHLTRVRLECAKTLIETTKMRTSDIAYEVGYNDTRYFSYVFRKKLGVTPREYRRRVELKP